MVRQDTNNMVSPSFFDTYPFLACFQVSSDDVRCEGLQSTAERRSTSFLFTVRKQSHMAGLRLFQGEGHATMVGRNSGW
jgi:hypothetical protein